MKTTELMCGDLILVDGRPTRVYGIMERMGRVYDTMTNDISIKRCQPIPLTPELLEKNGFVSAKKFRTHHFMDGNDVYVSVAQWGRTNILARGGKRGNRANVDCRYVHELQHALKICGIEKEIVL